MRENGRVFQRGNVQWIAYYLRGKEFRESARTDDPEKAKRFLKHRMREVAADQIGAKTFVTPQMQRVSINELLDALSRDLTPAFTPQPGYAIADRNRAHSLRRKAGVSSHCRHRKPVHRKLP